jgi:hypothetical protein
MEESSSQGISGEVFSALRYYAELCAGTTQPSGTIAFDRQFKDRGLQHLTTNDSSLIWIDGIYAGSLLQERFISSLLRGEIPTPLLDRRAKSLQSRILLTTPESLVTTPQTILAALGLTDSACAASLKSSKRLCSQCGAHITTYSSPSDVLNAINQDWNGQTISLCAQSSSERFSDWATTRGFSIENASNEIRSAHLDRLVCTAEALTPLGAIIHSAWRIPELRLRCTNTQGAEQVYSPAGWCAACAKAPETISKAQLTSVFTLGTKRDKPQHPEELLICDPPHTVEQLLDTPLRDLQLSPGSPFYTAKELFTILSIDTCTFGTSTNRLDARSLILVSIIATLLAVKNSHDQIIVDLPRNLLSASDILEVTNLLKRTSTTCGVSLLRSLAPRSEPLSPPSLTTSKVSSSAAITFSLPCGRSSTPSDFTLRAGDLLRISHQDIPSHTLFYDLTHQLCSSQQHAEIPLQIVKISLFNQLDRTTRVVGQELGLIEPLTQLYAASLDARSHGLTAKDFALFGTRSPRYVCPHCRGLGVVLDYHKQLPRPLASPCPACAGLRCKHPVSAALFRGVAFPTVLNQPIEQSYATLAALAKTKRPLEVSTSLGLNHLPLGMPVALLSLTERRKLAIASALCKGRPAKPVVVVLEASQSSLDGVGPSSPLAELRDSALVEGSVIWIEVL